MTPEYIAECEKDLAKKQALDEARERLRAREATPRTDAEPKHGGWQKELVLADFARSLERALARRDALLRECKEIIESVGPHKLVRIEQELQSSPSQPHTPDK